MSVDIVISPAIQEATKKYLQHDPAVREILSLDEEIQNKKAELIHLENKLQIAKNSRADIKIKWRESIMWCLTIDSKNPRYFLKNTAGVYKCIAYKHSIELTNDVKNKISITLANMWQAGKIGRFSRHGGFYYGLTDFFKKDLKTLKKEYEKDLDHLVS